MWPISPEPGEPARAKRTWTSGKKTSAEKPLLKATPKPLPAPALASAPPPSSVGPSAVPERFRTRQMVGFLRAVADLIDPDARPTAAPELAIQMLV